MAFEDKIFSCLLDKGYDSEPIYYVAPTDLSLKRILTNNQFVTRESESEIFRGLHSLVGGRAMVAPGHMISCNEKHNTCQHHLGMVEELRQHLDARNPPLNSILVLGLSGGALYAYLHQILLERNPASPKYI
ncbi:hypothetical protein OUZ56_016474 [Daphnia magna]|uniref:Uncharacterized protein n=1 Tax=Daphnia magna TaxID=35525 RepID=A0ABR0AQN8_9CRUS|nr:hypothetical protein OUZ56_016474 [Daphnia magna]